MLKPVGNPQLNKQATSNGAAGLILVKLNSFKTVYSENDETPKNCKSCLPLHVILVVSSAIN